MRNLLKNFHTGFVIKRPPESTRREGIQMLSLQQVFRSGSVSQEAHGKASRVDPERREHNKAMTIASFGRSH